MTLDEVIEHANRVADSYKDTAPACKSAHEYRQLADWLTELKVLRTENAELRELLDYVTPIAWYAASERERDHMRELGGGE